MRSPAEATTAQHWTTQFRHHAALIAGGIWLVLWGHQMLTHGTTQVNETRLALGLTWMDSGKLYVLPFALLAVTMVGLERSRKDSKWLGKASFAVVMLALGILALGTAFQFWPFPTGSYALTFEEAGGLVTAGGVLQGLGSLLLAVAVVPFGIDLARGKIIPGWITPILALGALTTVFLTPAFPWPAVAWVVLGLTLLYRRRASSD
jgi:hypothetical protein